MLKGAELVSVWVLGACLLVLGCQAFASAESDVIPSGPPPPPRFFGPQSSSVPAPPAAQRPPSPQPGAADAGEDAAMGTAPSPDAAPLEDAGPFQDAAIDASPAAGDAG